MKVKLALLKSAEQAIRKLATTDMPFKTTYRLHRILSVLDREFVALEKTRNEIITKLGKPDELGRINVPKEKLTDFHKEYNAILENEVEIKFDPIPEECLELCTLSVTDLAALEMFLEKDFLTKTKKAVDVKKKL